MRGICYVLMKAMSGGVPSGVLLMLRVPVALMIDRLDGSVMIENCDERQRWTGERNRIGAEFVCCCR